MPRPQGVGRRQDRCHDGVLNTREWDLVNEASTSSDQRHEAVEVKYLNNPEPFPWCTAVCSCGSWLESYKMIFNSAPSRILAQRPICRESPVVKTR
jgi:hypothetical protein